MKKKLLVALLAIIATLCCALCFTACGGDTVNKPDDGGNQISEYTVTFNANGGYFTDDETVIELKVKEGDTITPPSAPSHEKFNLKGWTVDKNSNPLWQFATEKVTGNITLYAVWDETSVQYTVTFDANGGTFPNGEENSLQIVDQGAMLTAGFSPTLAGYVFAGWTTDKTAKTLWDFNSDKVTSDITLFAIWKEAAATVLNVEGAIINSTDKSIEMVVESNAISVPLSNSVVCSEGSTWGLYYDELGLNGIATKIAVQPSGTLSDGDNTFYIIVSSVEESEINVYELTIHRKYAVSLNYYDNKGAIIKTENIYTKENCVLDFIPAIKGYDFNFWKDCNGNHVNEITPDSAVNIYADCTAKTYTVSYNANGGKGTLPSFSIESGKSFTANDGSAFDREYYTLLSYNTQSDGTGTEIPLGFEISDYDFAQDISLYAIWQCYYDFNNFSGKLIITGMNITDFSHLVIPDKIEENEIVGIASEAFKNLTKLQSVTVPDTVTSISSGAFSGCSNLESITLPFVGGVILTSKDNHQYPFGYIFGTTEYDGGTATNQYYYEYAENKNTTKITYYIPASLKEVTITGGNILYGAFYDCSGLTSITIPDGVTSIGGAAFCDCTSLTNITIPDSVTEIGRGAFGGCSGLETVKMPTCAISSIPKSSLKHVILTSGNSIEYRAFYECSNLESIVITDSVTTIDEGAFWYCANLTSITIPDSVTSIGNAAFRDCTALTSLTIPDSVTSIGAYTFYGCSKLTSVTIPDSITSIGAYMFRDCENLTSINIPESVTSIGEFAFYGCINLKSIVIPNGVTSIGGSTFSGCSNLESIVIPDGVTEIGYEAFRGCSNLESIVIPNGVTSISNNAFNYCSRLIIYCEAASRPESWDFNWNSLPCPTIWDYCKETDKDANGYAYTSIDGVCYRLKDGEATAITHLQTVKSYVTIPAEIIYKNEKYAVTAIDNNAFDGCKNLWSITIPDSITSIGSGAFRSTNINTITFLGTKKQWQDDIYKGDYWDYYTGNYTVHCSDGDLSKDES